VAEELGGYPLRDEVVRYAVAIKPLLKLPRSARILEAGCGSGRLLRALDALGYRRLVGLEISQQRLAQVRRYGPRSAELVCDPEVPFQPHSFDAVVAAGVIEHVENPRRWLEQLARVVRPGGMLSLTSDTYMWRWLARLGLYRSVQPIDVAIWPATLLRWARQAGLRLIRTGGFYNTAEQRFYLLCQLARLLPLSKRVQRLIRRSLATVRFGRWIARQRAETAAASPAAGQALPAAQAGEPAEVATILAALRLVPRQARFGWWHCLFSYESFYWFAKL